MKPMRTVTLGKIIWTILIVLLAVGIILTFSIFKKKNQEPTIDPVTTNEIKVVDYIDSKRVNISFNNDQLDVKELDIQQNIITLKESATYYLSGNNTKYKILVNAKNSVVKIVFNGLTTDQVENFIDIKNANKIIIEIAEKTQNIISSVSEQIDINKYIITSDVDTVITGTGTLNINAYNKFLKVNGNLNYNDSIIELKDLNNALTVEKNIEINSGTLYSSTTNEAILCNGNFEINDGKLIVTSKERKSININGMFLINNGQVIVASNEEIQKPNANSLQNSLILNFTEFYDKLLVLHDTQKIALAYQNENQYKHFLYSNFKLNEKSYILYAGGKISGTNAFGIYEVTDYMEDYQLTSNEAIDDIFVVDKLINIYNEIMKK